MRRSQQWPGGDWGGLHCGFSSERADIFWSTTTSWVGTQAQQQSWRKGDACVLWWWSGKVPLKFKRNPLAVCASVRVVSAKDASSTSTSTSTPTSMAQLPKQPKQEEKNDMMAIQTAIIRKEKLTRHIFRRGWNTSNSWKPFIIMPESQTYLNPKWVYSRADWPMRPMRSTMFQHDDFSWELVGVLQLWLRLWLWGCGDWRSSRCCRSVRNLLQFLEQSVNKSWWRLVEGMVIPIFLNFQWNQKFELSWWNIACPRGLTMWILEERVENQFQALSSSLPTRTRWWSMKRPWRLTAALVLFEQQLSNCGLQRTEVGK